MTIVVDSNVLFSSLLRWPNKFAENLFIDSHQYVIPKFAVVELFRHQQKIYKHAKLNEDEIGELMYRLLKTVTIFDETTLQKESLAKAYQLCLDTDLNDWIFVALALELNALLWTTDKKLIRGLSDKGFSNFYHI